MIDKSFPGLYEALIAWRTASAEAADAVVAEYLEEPRGCPHAAFPHGCRGTRYVCARCGAEICRTQCGNDALASALRRAGCQKCFPLAALRGEVEFLLDEERNELYDEQDNCSSERLIAIKRECLALDEVEREVRAW